MAQHIHIHVHDTAPKSRDSVPQILYKMSANALRKLINAAVRDFDLDRSWGVPSSGPESKRDELIEHLDDMCNEFGLTLGSDGTVRHGSYRK
jgi:hypothetical protein